MKNLRTTDSTIDELLQDIENLTSREQAAVLGLAEGIEKIGRRTDFERPAVQEVLARVFMFKERALQFERAASGLFDDLSHLGIEVDHLSDLEREGVGDGRAVAPLLEWFGQTQNVSLMHQIAIALGCAWVGDRGIEGLLSKFASLSEQSDPGPNSVRSTIVSSLEKHAAFLTPEIFLTIATSAENGFARAQAIRALARFPEERDALIPPVLELLASNEPDLYLESARLLGRWKVSKARDRIQVLMDTADDRHLGDQDQTVDPSWERDELRKALWTIPPSNVD